MKRASFFKVVLGGVMFAIVGSASAQWPPSREELRAQIVKSHYGVPEAVPFDPGTYENLIELLTDQQVQDSEASLLHSGKTIDFEDVTDSLARRAERMNRDFDTVRDLLGPEKFERYRTLRYTLPHRPQVRELDERLGAAHKLSASQREQLLEVLLDYQTRELEREREVAVRASSGEETGQLPSEDELQRRWLLRMLARNQEMWRRSTQAGRRLHENAAKVLTPPQLSMLQLQRTEALKQLQDSIERMRSQLGLSSTIPDQPQAAEAGLAAVAGELKLTIRLAVNRDPPKYFTELMRSGQPKSFQIGENLFMDATATLLEHDRFELRIMYYEVDVSSKRWIAGRRTSGAIVRVPPEAPSRQLGGGNGTVVTTSNQAYAVQLSSLVEPT
jgi:hypothetical protein